MGKTKLAIRKTILLITLDMLIAFVVWKLYNAVGDFKFLVAFLGGATYMSVRIGLIQSDIIDKLFI